jgi:hypothetical protein
MKTKPPAAAPSFLLSALFSAAAGAQTAGDTAITIYSSAQPGTLSSQTFKSGGEGTHVPGYALVRQERDFNLSRGRTVLRLSDVAGHIDPTTVSFESLTDPKGTRVVEQSFEFDLVSTNKLLQKYLDKDISAVQGLGTNVETVSGTLVGTQGGLVLKDASGAVRIVNGYHQVKLPTLPGGLISKPTLVWDIATDKPGTHKTRYAYQTGGITWWADYNLVYSEGKDANSCKLDVGSWVTIVNQSGTSYENAKLKLVAGDVQRAQPRPQYAAAPAARMELAAAKQADGFQEKSFFEYHLYTLGRPATLQNNSTKQIELFPTAHGANCEKNLVYYGQAGQYFGYYGSPMMDRDFGNQSNKKVDVYLRFKNAKDNQLGIPFPAGKVRVAKLDEADKSLEFIGEDLIDHTPRDETIQIKMGSAFDVVGERKQVSFRIDTTAKWMEEEIEVKVRNQKDEPVTVIVKETLHRWTSWNVIKKSQNFEKQDSRTIHFPVRIAKSGEAVVRYTVKYTW